MRTLIALILTTAIAAAQDKPLILVTTDSGGGFHFTYLEIDAATGIPTTRKVDDRTFLVVGATPKMPDDPTDPPPAPGVLRKLTDDVEALARAVDNPGAAAAWGVTFSKLADALEAGTLAPSTAAEKIKLTINTLIPLTGAKWEPIRTLIQDAIVAQINRGQLTTAADWARLIDAVARGCDKATGGAVNRGAAAIDTAMSEADAVHTLEATADGFDWAMWLPIILAILRLLGIDLGI